MRRETVRYPATQNQITLRLMAAAFAVALAIVLVVRITAAPEDKLVAALRATARWSFVLFWLATAGGALATLFGSRFKALAARGRELGLAYASAHLVHLGLVVWIYLFYTPLPQSTLIFFGIAVFWTYLLALLSIRRISAILHPRFVRILRAIGVEYIAFAFLVDFLVNPFQDGVVNLLAYLPFQILAIGGPLLRLAAAARRLYPSRRVASS
jgi:hypothetical protein